MEKKTCKICKKELPKNEDYFFISKSKYKLKDGSVNTYSFFSGNCKRCVAAKKRKQRNNLSNWYVSQTLRQQMPELVEITPEMIELKREILMIGRKKLELDSSIKSKIKKT